MSNKKVKLSTPDDMLHDAHSVIRELLDKAWELGGYTVGSNEFNDYYFVKSARELLDEIDNYFGKGNKAKFPILQMRQSFKQMINDERKHWIDAGKPDNHIYLYLLMLKEKLNIVEEYKALKKDIKQWRTKHTT